MLGLIAIVFASLVIPKNPTQFEFFANWKLIVMAAVFLVLFVLLVRKIYTTEKQNQLDEILNLLEVEVEEKKIENEWSTKNTLIRMFTYPFCLFLILITIFLLIPEGQYGMALSSFSFVGFYLVTDLKMLFRK